MRRLAVVAVLALAGAGAASAQDASLSVRGTLTPSTIRFGDPVTAEVQVTYDPNVIDAESVRAVPGFGAFGQTSSPTVTRTSRGDLAVVTTRYTLQCLADGCLPAKGALEKHLPRLTVIGTEDGRRVRATASWPVLTVVSRAPSGTDVGAFRHQRDLPSPAYAVSPGALAAGLVAFAVLAAAAAVALLVRELRRRPSREPGYDLSPLERALRYARDSARRPDPADRRRALELLAEAVEDGGDDRLAGEVRGAAWVAPPPAPDRPLELADAVEEASHRS